MDFSIAILIVAIAAVAYFVWNQRKRSGDSGKAAAPSAAPPASMPAATPRSAASPSAAPAAGSGGALASYDEYRRTSPSNMVYNKLTCNRCGSNLIRTTGGMASCMSCGAALYRA
jgi:hypothetical protein